MRVQAIGLMALSAALALADSKLLMLATLIVLAVYFWILSSDLNLASELIDFVRISNMRSKSAALYLGTAKTAAGQKLLAEVEALRYLLHATEAELDSQQFIRCIGSDGSITPRLASAGEKVQPAAELEFYRQILSFIADGFACDACALVFEKESVLSDGKVICHGVSGQRIERCIYNALEPFFGQGKKGCLDLRDGSGTDTPFEGFLAFGLRYTLAAPLSWCENRRERRGVLWMAFSDKVSPRAERRELINEAVQRIEKELKAQRMVCELSGKIAKAECNNQQKSEFIAHMSHDIRSPLNNIKSILTLFKLDGFSADSAEMIEIALNNCENMSEIVEDILDFSKHSAGKLLAYKQQIDLTRCVENVAESFMVTARMKGLDLQVKAAERCCVTADPRQVKRIVGNLISNAVKYTEKGKIEVSIEICRENRCCLRIKDSGIGMSSQQVAGLFAPFTRFHGAEIEGIGLGLALTKILLELNKGDIEVCSQPGRGSEFRVYLPDAQILADACSLPDDSPVARPQQRKLRILLADDDVDCVNTLARALELADFICLKAFSVSEALQIINHQHVDAVVSDGIMPDGGVKRLLEKILLSAEQLPVVVVSGRDGENFKRQYTALGACRVFAKPVDVNDLASCLVKLCADQQQRHKNRQSAA